jgi:hypothetical protein
MNREYGYHIAEGTEPSLRELIRKLLVSECYEQLDTKERPVWLQSQLLATPTGRVRMLWLCYLVGVILTSTAAILPTSLHR